MKIYDGGCIDTIFFYIIKKNFLFPPHHHPYPFLQVPPFHNYYMRNSLKRGGSPLFSFLDFCFFFSGVAAWRHARNGKKFQNENLWREGGGFPTLDRRSRAFGVVVGGGMRKGRGGESWENDAVWQPPHQRTGGRAHGGRLLRWSGGLVVFGFLFCLPLHRRGAALLGGEGFVQFPGGAGGPGAAAGRGAGGPGGRGRGGRPPGAPPRGPGGRGGAGGGGGRAGGGGGGGGRGGRAGGRGGGGAGGGGGGAGGYQELG
nr:hypothetical protein [Morchella crassipes]